MSGSGGSASGPTARPSPRRAAAVLVAEVLENGRALDDALADTRSFTVLEGRDRGFARAIASTTLRRLGGIDDVLRSFLEKPLEQAAPLARAILRTGAAQLLAMGTPPHAVVSESVELARSARSTAALAGLMNAVLRRVAAEGSPVFAAHPPGRDLPDWIFARWRAAFGDAIATDIAAALRSEPPLDLTVKGDADGWAARLGGVAINARTVRLHDSGDVATLQGFEDGAWWVQDAAAASPVPMLGDMGGLSALDMCAAPGGKTLQLAAAGARVTAVDLSADRLSRVLQNLQRTRLDAEIAAADVRTWDAGERVFDVVLLDAPCSATGTFRRHPDAAWLRRPTDIPHLAELQLSLLERAIALTAPGGRILYVVCSLEPEEGEGLVARALKAWGDAIDAEGAPLRTTPADLPGQGGMDGFFAQVLRRR